MKTAPYGGKIIRNLLMHVWPTKNGVWRWNVAQVLRRMGQFNGQRIVSVVTDEGTESFETVRQAFQGTVQDFQHFPNNPTLGETVSFEYLLKRVENIDPRQMTLYCHAKGAKYNPPNQQVKEWTRVMYANLLDYPGLVEDCLRAHPLCGTFVKSGNQFGKLPPSWHYAGTFFWFRNAAIFHHPSWNRIPRAWWGTEAWPGIVCPKEEAGCLFIAGEAMDMQMYSAPGWQRKFGPAWKEWQIDHAGLVRSSRYAEVRDALRLLGVRRVVVTGPQRSGTTIAAQILARDLLLPYIPEESFGAHDLHRFLELTRQMSGYVVQAPGMSSQAHLMEGQVVWMHRSHSDIQRSERRVDWQRHERQERDKYFDHTRRPMPVVKGEAWQKFQRIALGERAYDLDYETMRGDPLWIDAEERHTFGDRQTAPAGVTVGQAQARQEYPPKAICGTLIGTFLVFLAMKPDSGFHRWLVFEVPPKATITLNGKAAKLGDLPRGCRVCITPSSHVPFIAQAVVATT